MKNKIITVLFILMSLFSGNSFCKVYDINTIRPDTTYDLINFYECQNDTVIYRKIHKDIPAFAFQVNVINTSMYSPVKEIVIKDSETKKTIQTLNSERDSLFIINMEFNDYNFDGYLDLYLYDGCAILGNCFGKIYTFDPKKNVFVYNRAFDEMTSVSVNKNRKEIYSFNQCCAGASSTYAVFRYSDGKLYKYKEINKDFDGKSKFIYVVTEYDKNGKELKSKKIESEDMDLDFE